MKPNTLHTLASSALAIMFFLVPAGLLAQASGDLSYFTISDIGDPKPWKPGQVTVGDSIGNVVITARDADGSPVTEFNGLVYLSQHTDDGIGRISPETVHLTNGEWQGVIKIFRAGKKRSDFQVVGDVWVSITDNAANPHSGTSNLFTAVRTDFSRLLIVVPGEEHLPGSVGGSTGQPFNQQIGTEISISVLATDAYWNRKRKISDTVHLISSDPTAILPDNAAMESGEVSFNVTLSTDGTQTITAFDVDNLAGVVPHTSSNIKVFTDLPDSVSSFVFNPIPSPQTVGDTLQLRVTAVDNQGRTVDIFNRQASLSASTGPGTLLAGQVVFSSGVWTGQIVLTQAGASVVFTMRDFSASISGESDPVEFRPGTAIRLQILLPGETATPGFAPGKMGQPESHIATEVFPVQVRVVDAWWHPTQTQDLQISFTANDPEANLPGSVTQTEPQTDYDVSFQTEGQTQIDVTVLGHPTLSGTYTSSRFFVDSGIIDTFIFSEIDSQQVAGQPFNVRIDAINSDGKVVANYNEEIILFASTGNGTLSRTGVRLTNGSWEGELSTTRADGAVAIFAADLVEPPNTHTGSSSFFAVVPDSLVGWQIVYPGQTITPGLQFGFNSAPTPQAAGDSIHIVVRAVDAFWNTVPGVQDSIAFSATDRFAVLPDSAKLENGLVETAVVFRAASNQQLAVRSVSRPELPAATSEFIEITPNVFSQLLTLLPGETLLPGDTEVDPNKTPGKANEAAFQTTKLPFEVQVYAIDDFYNHVPGTPPDVVSLIVTDGDAAITPSDTVLVNGSATFRVTLSQGGNQVIRAQNLSDSNIDESMNTVVRVLSGGLHYEVVLSSGTVTAGESFQMEVIFKNAVGDQVASANQLVNLSVVLASTLADEVSTLENSAFNLQAGRRAITQKIYKAEFIRIKVTDELGTAPAFSDPLTVAPGKVVTLDVATEKAEIGPTQEAQITVRVIDSFGNLIPQQEVLFEVMAGSGTVSNTRVLSDSSGVASVIFKGGQITESNTIRVIKDSVFANIHVVVNLTLSDFPDGKVVNYPNPFGIETETTHIDYYLSEDADVTLRIFDLFGNLVWTKEMAAGAPGGRGRDGRVHPNSVEWAGVNGNGQRVGNGGYILLAKATANGKQIMNTKRKIVVLR